ncbi:MAG: hypothetical protein HZB87_01745 [Desulfatitalea sp.]|nr:hypothetical protein [Desulfatitalea sp.]MBI5895102.1 hypothetical protein [Desulfobacterales bacterium]
MLFNSVHFAFFIIAAALLAATPARHRWIPLLAARGMSACAGRGAKKTILCFCLMANIGTLFFLKYFNFFSRSLNEALRAWNIFADVPI